MIPLKLTIEGLYSYRSRQTIDFTNLTQSGLFGIFGGVGSGKSSILEAISFSLYGESQRLGGKDNRSYNMMNLKSDRLYIDFEFRIGLDNRYRFVVQGKRNSKRFEDVKSFDRSAYHFENDQWMPIDIKSIEAITGLNYENFHRTIIIPQGKFQEFLQLSASVRTNMLMELFNLSKYDLFLKITGLESRNNTNITRISSTMEGIGEVTPERITELSDKKSKLQSGLETLKKVIEGKVKDEQKLEILKKLTDDIASKKVVQENLIRSEVQIKELESRIMEFERMTRIFKSDTIQLADAEQHYESSNRQLKDAREKLIKIKEEYAVIHPVYEALKKEYDKKELLIREAEELERYAEVKKIEKLLELLSGSAEGLLNKLQENEGLILSGKQQHEAKTKELEEKRKSLPDIRKLADVKAWFTEKKRLHKEISDRRIKEGDIVKAIQEIYYNMMTEMTASGIFETIPEGAGLIKFQDIINVRKTELESLKTDLDTRRSGLEIRHKLEEYAAELHDGQPCPLCGSENHPDVLNPTDVTAKLEKLKTEAKAFDDQQKKCSSLEKSLTSGQTLEKAHSMQKENLKRELLSLKAEEKEHEDKFTWKEYDKEDESRIISDEALYEQINIAISRTEKELGEISITIERNGKILESTRIEAGKVDNQISSAKSQMEILVSQIRLIDMQLLKELSADQLLVKAKERRNQHDDLVSKFSDADKKRENLSIEINTLSGQVSAMKRANDDFLDRMEMIKQKVASKLKENGGVELTYVLEVLGQDVDVEGGRKRIEKYKQDLESVRNYLEEKIKELSGRVYDETMHEQLKEEIQTKKDAMEATNREIGELQKEITTLATNAARYAVLKTELDEIRLRGKDITELKNLFWGSGFVNYVSTIYLQNLCKAANERFYKLTRQQLGLELGPDNSFNVRDYMNEGHVRSAKSLSGGQTFQASLSLALSLADSIHRIAGSSENFFFLDEGFGTLDKETLEVAFDTLKSLRKENRIVGVISHVEEMQAEIETYLKVSNDEEHGSIVKASWEN